MKFALASFILLTGPLFAQYSIDSFAGRFGPSPGDVALNHPIESNGILVGNTGSVFYFSNYQLVEILPTGIVGRVLGIEELRFDWADGGDRDYFIVAGAIDPLGRVYLLEWNYWRLLRVDTDGTVTAISLPKPAGPSYGPGLAAAAANGILYVAGLDLEVQRIDFNSGQATVIAGNGTQAGFFATAPDGAIATSVAVAPQAVAVDASDAMFFLDSALLRSVDDQGRLTSVEAQATPGFSGINNLPLVAAPDGTLLVGDNCGIARVDPRTGTRTKIAAGQSVFECFVLRLPDGRGLAQDTNGTIYFSLPGVISTIDDATGQITDIAGADPSGDPMLPTWSISMGRIRWRRPRMERCMWPNHTSKGCA